MAYQALYRKWRPSVFEDVVGQNHIVETIKNQINTNKIAHAYLFCGSRGTGKTSTAKIFSRAVNCEHPVNGNPCNECDTCKGILNNSIFDVVEIDGASNNKVDDIRNIRDEVVYPPANARYKVYIIDEVHMLTTEAFNALLKTLEEPPAYVIFILATTEFHKIPATIISRCQKFDFKRITYKDTAARIKKVAESDGINVTDSAVKLLAKAADGSLRDGLSKLDQCLALGITKIGYKDVANIIGASDPEFLSDFCEAIIDERLGDSLKLLDEGVNIGIDPLRLFTDTVDYFRDLLMIKSSNDYSLIINDEEEVLTKYERQCDKLSLPRILKVIEVLFEGLNIAKYSASPKLAFETVLLKISSKNTNADIDVVLDRLEMLEKKVKEFSEGKTAIVENPSSVQETKVKNTLEPEQSAEQFEEMKKDSLCEPDINSENIATGEAVSETDDEYDFSSHYDYSEDPDEVFSDFESAAMSFGNPDDSFETVDSFNDENTGIDTGEAVKLKDILEKLSLNFADFLVNIRNKDFGFDNIMKSAAVSFDDTGLVFIFSNRAKLDIAKNNKYDALIKEAVHEAYNVDISVILQGEETKTAQEVENEDPFDDLFKLAEQNQIIFNFED